MGKCPYCGMEMTSEHQLHDIYHCAEYLKRRAEVTETEIERLHSEDNQQVKELAERVLAFASQLQAWDMDDAASNLIEEVLGNKVNAPDYYALKGEVERLRVENIRLKERLAFCEECLIAMVEQYCGDYNGLNYDDIPTRFTHDYMSAGEMTFSYLVKHGLAQLDENGVDIIFPEAK